MGLASPSLRLTLLALLIHALAAPAAAQTSNATLSGTITDTGGGVLPGVTVNCSRPPQV